MRHDADMVSDPRVPVVEQALLAQGHERAHEAALAAIAALEDFYGSARYWMSAKFERERIIREVELLVPRCPCECCERIVEIIRQAM